MIRDAVWAGLVFYLAASNSLAWAQSQQDSKPAAKTNSPPAVAKSEIALSRLATEKNFFFLASNGWGTARTDTSNKMEKFWAEKSVQKFFRELGDEILGLIRRQSERDPNAAVWAEVMPELLLAAARHPVAVSLEDFSLTPPPEVMPAVVNLCVVIDTESDEARLRPLFEKLAHAIMDEDSKSYTEEVVAGATFYLPKVSPEETEKITGFLPRFGMYKSYLIMTTGPEMLPRTISRLDGKEKQNPSPWLEATMKELSIDRPSMVWHVDLPGILDAIDITIDDPIARALLEVTGVNDIERIEGVSGLDENGFAIRMTVATNSAPKGVLTLFPDKPLTVEDLKRVPSDVHFAHVARFDLAVATETILSIVEEVNPQAREQFDMISLQAETFLGFSIKNDLLKGFDDSWTFYGNTERPMFPQFVLSATVRDQEKVQAVESGVLRLANQVLPQFAPQIKFEEFKVGENTGHRVNLGGPLFMLMPSWVVTRDQFVLSVSQWSVTKHLEAASKTFADLDSVQAAMKRDPQTVMLSYADPKSELQSIYFLVNGFAPMFLANMKKEGIDLTLPALPPMSDLEPHLAPTVTTIARVPTGLRYDSRGVIPSVATPAVLTALLLPAVQQAREAARRTLAKNNLKQIALSMHNYADLHGRFPARVLLDSNDKPGLSWRVSLLPFLDQQALYNEFHLDEPWDSEHNKTLIKRMPVAFQSPNDPHLNAEGKTRYVVPVGEGFLFDSEIGPTIQEVTDGLSNTIMTLEATADHAVIWTRPDDLKIDPNDLLMGLKGSRIAGFLAGMADGAIRFVSENTDADTMHALFTKNGGEVIGDF